MDGRLQFSLHSTSPKPPQSKIIIIIIIVIIITIISGPYLWRNKTPTTKPILSFDLILMSALTWITEKELEREVKKRRPNSLKEKHENL